MKVKTPTQIKIQELRELLREKREALNAKYRKADEIRGKYSVGKVDSWCTGCFFEYAYACDEDRITEQKEFDEAFHLACNDELHEEIKALEKELASLVEIRFVEIHGMNRREYNLRKRIDEINTALKELNNELAKLTEELKSIE